MSNNTVQIAYFILFAKLGRSAINYKKIIQDGKKWNFKTVPQETEFHALHIKN